MVKNKDITIIDLIKTTFNTNIISKKNQIKSLLIYLAIMNLLLIIVTSIKYSYTYSAFSIPQLLLITVFGLFLILFIFHSLNFIFIKSFTENENKFWHSFLISYSIFIPFIIINTLITTINNLYMNIISIIIIVYSIINLILNLKKYYSTTYYKIIASIILTNLIFLMISIINYLFYLVKIINTLS